jgi:hypothetical protein
VKRALTVLNDLKPKSRKAKSTIALLASWLNDDSGYDEEAWPELKEALDRERARVGARGLFDA